MRHGRLSDKNHKYLHGLPVEGCTLSEEERLSRKRVIDGPNDPRLQEARFKEAMAVVANNDAALPDQQGQGRRTTAEHLEPHSTGP